MINRPTQVVNIRFDGFTVYCGRAASRLGLARSKWANPFYIGRDGSRQEVIEKYRAWLFTQPELLRQLGELYGHKLGCWCAPEACHCHVLAKLADQVHESNIPADTQAIAQLEQGYCLSCGEWTLAPDPNDGHVLRCGACNETFRPQLAVLTHG